MKKKGFTLIELLAVIVILAIIALIAVPVIMNVINKANKSAFKDTAYGIISAGELYFAEHQLELNGMSEEETFAFPTKEIEIKGDVPAGTVLKVNTNGETALAMSNGRYCVTKGYSDNDITITENIENCYVPYTLQAVATVTTQVTSIPACATDGTNCAPGTAFAIKVNDTDTYKFRVLNDENNVVTLIMSSNLYEEGNITEPDVEWNFSQNNAKGPLTLLETLKERTSNWTNIEEYSYTLEDQDEMYADYSGEYVQNVRARLPRRSDIITDAIGCTERKTTCPDWLYEGLYETGDNNTNGYWLSDASFDYPTCAWRVNSYGSLSDNYGIGTDTRYGIRPVITITK